MSSESAAIAARSENRIEREGFGSREMERRGETAPTSLGAAAQAEVQARYIMALQRPRSAANARVSMLTECRRPGFAKVAIFRKPVGRDKSVEGLSIRFAEAAARAWGNILVGREVVSDDRDRRVMRVSVTDLEANLTESLDIVVEKIVERKSLREGQRPKGQRVNSYGDLVYLVEATESDLLTKQRAEEAKAKRTCVLAMIPGDIQEECKRQIYQTQADEDARDPDAAKKTLMDAFAEVGVKPSDLEAYLGHSVDAVAPAELMDLRGVYTAIRDGVVAWAEVLYARTGASGEREDAKAKATTEKIKANLEKQRAKKSGGHRANGGLSPERRTAIAEQVGVAVEVVAAVERFAGGNDTEETIVRALRAEKLSADEPQVAEIIAEIRKG